MPNGAQDGSAQWLVTLFVSLFAGGVGWLVKHLAGRQSSLVSLNLQGAQTEEIRARIRREDETTAVTTLKTVAGELRADVQRLRDERDYWQARAEKAERRPLEEALKGGHGRGPLLPPGE
jgi:uncharacterized protein YhaN